MIRFRELALSAAVVAIAAPAAAEPVAGDDRALVLGEHFYEAGQFYRAVGAFEELALFTGDRELAAYARLRIAMAFQRGQQHADAVAAYDRWLAELPLAGSLAPLAPWVRIQRALARAGAAEDRDRRRLDDVVAELAPLAATDGDHRATAAYHLARLQLLDGQRAGARRTVADATARCRTRPIEDCDALARVARAAAAPGPRRRSPALGVALSAIAPGAGSFYSGHAVDGLYYLGLTSASVLGMVDVHDGDRGLGDQKVTFYVLGTLAVATYTASLVQAYFGARRFNLAEDLRWRRRAVAATEGPLPLDAPPGRLRALRGR
jgi:hypothetical protein